MNEAVIASIITTGGVIVVALISGFFGLWLQNRKTYHAVNGRMDELLVLTKSMAKVEAVVEERDRVAEDNA